MDGTLSPSTEKIVGGISPRKTISGSMSMPAAVRDYEGLVNKPEINGVTVEGNKTGEEFGLVDQEDFQVLNAIDLLNIFNNL